MASPQKELELWLERRWMGRFANVLLEANWTSLSSLKTHSDEQRADIIALFEKPGHRLKMRLLLEELKAKDIDDIMADNMTRQGEPSVSVPPPPMAQDDSSDTDTSSSDSDGERQQRHQRNSSAQPGAAAPSTNTPTPSGPVDTVPDTPLKAGSVLPPPPAPPAQHKLPPPPIPPVPADAPPPVPSTSLPDSLPGGSRDRGESSSSSSTDDGEVRGRGPTQKSVPPGRTPPSIPAELPPFPDSDSDSSDEETEQPTSPASAKVPPATSGSSALPPRPKSAAAPREARSNTGFRKRKEEMERKLAEGTAVNPPPLRAKGSVKISASSELKAKMAALGGIKFGQPPPKAIKKKLQPAREAPAATAGSDMHAAMDLGGLLQGESVEDLAGPSPHELLQEATKAGHLDKRGTGMVNKRWKDRFFILSGTSLYWLKNEMATVCQGAIDLTERGIVIRLTEDHRTVEITNSKKSYVLRAATADDMDKWLKALRAVRADLPEEKVPEPTDSIDPTDGTQVEKMMDMLKIGAMFIKYKRKKGKDRMIWCPVGLDRVMWGDQTKRKVKGFILVSDIQRISEGCFGAKNVDNSFTLISPQRTLELEATSATEKQRWMQALQYLVDKGA